MGADVEVKLYRAKDGAKMFHGPLKGYDNGDVTIAVNGQDMTFAKKEIALTRLYIEF
jgi:ribosome maturation factor RimP